MVARSRPRPRFRIIGDSAPRPNVERLFALLVVLIPGFLFADVLPTIVFRGLLVAVSVVVGLLVLTALVDGYRWLTGTKQAGDPE